MARTATPAEVRRVSGTRVSGSAHAPRVPILSRRFANKLREKYLHHDDEKHLFDLMVEEAERSHILGQMDAGLLIAWAQSFTVYLLAAREVGQFARAKQWDRLVAEKGGAYKGAMAVGNKAFDQVMEINREMGFTPAARAKMRTLNSQSDLFDQLPNVVDEIAGIMSAAINEAEVLRPAIEGECLRDE